MESGNQADSRRLGAIPLLPDGSTVVPRRLARWVRSLILQDVGDLRRLTNGGRNDILMLLDALTEVPEVAERGNDHMPDSKIVTGDAPDADLLSVRDLVSTREAANLLECAERTVRWRLERGVLRGWKPAHTWLVYRSSIDEFLDGKAA